jgi:hypothetical protein
MRTTMQCASAVTCLWSATARITRHSRECTGHVFTMSSSTELAQAGLARATRTWLVQIRVVRRGLSILSPNRLGKPSRTARRWRVPNR